MAFKILGYRSYHILEVSQLTVGCVRSFTKKVKYPESTIRAIKRWNAENLLLYGPLQNSKSKASKKTNNRKPGRPPKKAKDVIRDQSVPTLMVPIDNNQQDYQEFVTEDLVVTPDDMPYSECVQIDEDKIEVLGVDSEDSTPEGTAGLCSNDSHRHQDSPNEFLNRPAEEKYSFPKANVEMVNSMPTIEPLDNADKTPKQDLSHILTFPLLKTEMTVQDTRYSQLNLSYMKQVSRTPSVTQILKETMSDESKYFLERWENEMIDEMGEEGFAEYKKEMFRRGHSLHKSIQEVMEGQAVSEVSVDKGNQGHWQSLLPVLGEISDVEAVENRVTHPHLNYKGVLDCVARYKDELCVIDWKTSKRQKSRVQDTFDNPLQLAAYAGALNFDRAFPQEIKNLLLVISYEDGQTAHTHYLNQTQCQYYWKQWLRRLHQFWTSKPTLL